MENYYEYINEESIEKNLICDICQKPMIEPVTISTEKICCRLCLKQLSDDAEKDIQTLTDSSILIKLDQIQGQCKLCNEKNLQQSNFSTHMIKYCPKAIITCPGSTNDCPWIGLREELHKHLNECSYESLTKDSQREQFGKFLPCKKINLQERHFHHQDIATAAKALIIHKRLTCLDLFNKGLTSQGASIIASVLENDNYLDILIFRNNYICDSGVQFLSHALRTNSHLKILDLNENSITDIGIRLLSDMLTTNQTINKLTLSFNRITNEGFYVLIDTIINYNQNLQWLSLSGNININDVSIDSIFNLIRTKNSLKTLNLEQCGFSWMKKKEISLYQIMHHKSKLDIWL